MNDSSKEIILSASDVWGFLTVLYVAKSMAKGLNKMSHVMGSSENFEREIMVIEGQIRKLEGLLK